uniref:G-protein coupled receptors family 1 profile domain-containing protein n=1 Tax=Glossina brevipalpis TaxID=37001 RepID=A0A1A9WY90_9MUSC
MNETECEDLIKSVKWTEPSNLISLAILEFINVLVIGGNLLVIAAVFCSNKLRSVTNFFIVNLAVADLLVGLAVLPFSATWEVFKVWIFGDVWCRIWLAVDVWMCTASILNLCAISLDRYVAVTRPVTYPSIMSTKRAKSLIAGIWVLSFVICFPPLVGWKDQKPLAQPITYTRGNYTLYYATTSTKATTITTSTISSTTSPSSLPLRSPLSASSFADWPAITTAEQKVKLRPQNTYAASTAHNLPPTPVKASVVHHNDFNPYDPYHAHLSNYNDTSTITNNAMNNYDNNNNDDNNDSDSDAVDSSVGIEDVYSLTPDAPENILHNNNRPSLSSSTLLYDDNAMDDDNDDDDDDTALVSGRSVDLKATETATARATTSPLPCPWKCELTNDRGYVLYSALGSFYIPMFVMLFFYWRIYRAAVRTTRAINQGFKTTKGGGHESHTNRPDETQLVLRIHRGRPCTTTTQRTPLSINSMSSMLSVNSNGDETLYGGLQPSQFPQQQSSSSLMLPKRATSMRLTKQKHEKVGVKVSFPSSENMMDSSNVEGTTAAAPTYKAIAIHEGSAAGSAAQNTLSLTNGQKGSFKSSLCNIGETTFNTKAFTTTTDSSTMALNHQRDDVEIGRDSSQKQDKKQRGKRSVRFQVKRFKVETKAAKTLAIIVGGFIFCWLPFFTMYLIRAFCDHCIPATVFSVLFWLGYCNSAINPVIYALFSHEFRIAFKRIVCRCVCTRSGFRASENFQMIAARALMAPATFHKTISGCSDDGDGDGDGDGPDFS